MKRCPPATAEDPQEEIAALVHTLHETQQRLQALAGDEVDAVVLPGGQSYLLHEAQEKLWRSETALHDLATKQSSILNALPAHIALLDHEGAILSVNEGWRSFAEGNGLQNSAAGVGRNYLEVCDQAHGNCAAEAHEAAAGIRAVLAGKVAEFALEYPCHSPTEQRWFQLRVNPIEGGVPRGAVVMHVAITERKRAEDEMRWKTAFLEAQVSASLDGILIVDPQGKKILQNEQLNDLLKIPRHIVDDPDDGEQLRWVRAMVRNPEPFLARVLHLYSHPGEIGRDEIELKDGTLLERYSAPVVGKCETYYGRIWTFRDITGRRRAEARIVEQAALIDEARDAIIVHDLEHRITFWSKGAERIYGWTADEACGSLLYELLQADADSFAEADRVVRKTGAWNGEIQKQARNGAALTLDGRWTLVRDAHGQAQSILTIDTDITERKKLELQFLRSQRMESIGTLAGGIAHDLNNVLSPIMMAVEVMKIRFPDPDSQDLLSILSSSAQRGADMVRQVLSFARGVEGRRMEVQVRHLIQDIEKTANDTFLKNIQVRTVIPHGLWTVMGDPTQLHQVLLNLCVNARDAMPDGGNLVISARNLTLDAQYVGMNSAAKPGPYVFIQVEDSGTGMPKEVIEKIFEPFFTTKEVGKGTGLGLSTSLAIVKSHGGFFQVYSEPGKGTTFKVHLPAQIEVSAETAAEIAAELPRGHGELILVVDDEASVRQITQQTLEAFGYRVLLASDGTEAVAIYATRRAEIAVVLTDMMMPAMNGIEAIRFLRGLHPAVRIIASSGLSANSQAAGLGVNYFLSKPYTAETLLKTLKETLSAT